jgi:Zn-dependent peptidase ImmA (M78 family)
MTIDFICSEVHSLCEKYGERDPWRLAGEMGVIVRCEPMGADKNACKGFFIYQSRKRLVTINRDLPGSVQRIILAHELGHAVLHRDEARLRAFQDFSLYESNARFEYEANLFAAELLLDDSEVLERLREDDLFFAAAKRLAVPPELLDFKLRILRHKGMCVDSPILSRSDFLKNGWKQS